MASEKALHLVALVEGIVTLESIVIVQTLPDRGQNLQCRGVHAWQMGHERVELAAWVKLHEIAGIDLPGQQT